MKGLPTLIKLKNREIETQQREIGQLEAELLKLKREEDRLLKELEREKSMASKQPQMAPFFGDFSRANEQKQDRLREIQNAVLQEIDLRKEQMAELFGDLKKLDITQERINAEALRIKEKKEQEQLDEIAIEQHRRRQNENNYESNEA